MPVHLPKSVKLKEKHQFEEYTAFQFHKPVVRYRIGKFTAQVYPDIVKVIMLEVGECPETEHYLFRAIIPNSCKKIKRTKRMANMHGEII